MHINRSQNYKNNKGLHLENGIIAEKYKLGVLDRKFDRRNYFEYFALLLLIFSQIYKCITFKLAESSGVLSKDVSLSARAFVKCIMLLKKPSLEIGVNSFQLTNCVDAM